MYTIVVLDKLVIEIITIMIIKLIRMATKIGNVADSNNIINLIVMCVINYKIPLITKTMIMCSIDVARKSKFMISIQGNSFCGHAQVLLWLLLM